MAPAIVRTDLKQLGVGSPHTSSQLGRIPVHFCHLEYKQVLGWGGYVQRDGSKIICMLRSGSLIIFRIRTNLFPMENYV
jgi:hypothetical protein